MVSHIGPCYVYERVYRCNGKKKTRINKNVCETWREEKVRINEITERKVKMARILGGVFSKREKGMQRDRDAKLRKRE
jgi:CRISPR/Cas system-associated protein endoribonuclease Cas2